PSQLPVERRKSSLNIVRTPQSVARVVRAVEKICEMAAKIRQPIAVRVATTGGRGCGGPTRTENPPPSGERNMGAFAKLASVLKGTSARVGKIPGLKTVNCLWINAGHMRWMDNMPGKYFSSLDILTKSNAELDSTRSAQPKGMRGPRAWQNK